MIVDFLRQPIGCKYSIAVSPLLGWKRKKSWTRGIQLQLWLWLYWEIFFFFFCTRRAGTVLSPFSPEWSMGRDEGRLCHEELCSENVTFFPTLTLCVYFHWLCCLTYLGCNSGPLCSRYAKAILPDAGTGRTKSAKFSTEQAGSHTHTLKQQHNTRLIFRIKHSTSTEISKKRQIQLCRSFFLWGCQPLYHHLLVAAVYIHLGSNAHWLCLRN